MEATNFLIGAPNTLITNIAVVSLSFLILMMLLKKFAWGPLMQMLDKRADQVSKDLESAESSRVEASKLAAENDTLLKESRTEATTIVRKAKETAEKDAHTIVENAHAEGKRYLEQAKREIEIERAKMIESAKKEVADLSVQIAEKIIKKELDPETHQALINSYIEGLGRNDEN